MRHLTHMVRALGRWLGDLDGQWAEGVIRLSKPNTPRGRIGTGCDVLDRILGGGWQRGALNVVDGGMGSGKTSLVLQSLSYNVQEGQRACYLDMEGHLEALWPCGGGPHGESLLVGEPPSAELMFEWVMRLLAADCLDLLVIDSLGWWITQEECLLGWGGCEGFCRRWNIETLRALNELLKETQTALVIVIPSFRPTVGEEPLVFVGEAVGWLAATYVRLPLPPTGAEQLC